MDNPDPAANIYFQLNSIFRPDVADGIPALIIAIIILSLLLFVSALIAGCENAFFSLNKDELELFAADGSTQGRSITYLMANPKILIATLLITNNFINIAFVISSEWVFALVLEEHIMRSNLFFLFQVGFVTFIIVFLAEITPKIYATQNYLNYSKTMAKPVFYLSKIWKPFVYLLVKSTSVIDKRITRRGHELTIDDLEHAIDLTTDDNGPEEEKEVLKNIVNFGNIEVKQIMKSRLDVRSLNEKTTFKEVLEKIKEWEYSRIPVYRESFDTVTGILHVKDLLPYLYKEDFEWITLIRVPFFVPPSKKIDDLLREFQVKRVHMAVVVDEYGGTMGVVTMEDILEEIFGEIHDEFDEEELTYTRLDENTFVFEGKMLLNDICRIMEIKMDTFEVIRGEAETLAGLLLEIEGRIPAIREKINWDNFVFTIEAADKRRIKRVKIEYKPMLNG